MRILLFILIVNNVSCGNNSATFDDFDDKIFIDFEAFANYYTDSLTHDLKNDKLAGDVLTSPPVNICNLKDYYVDINIQLANSLCQLRKREKFLGIRFQYDDGIAFIIKANNSLLYSEWNELALIYDGSKNENGAFKEILRRSVEIKELKKRWKLVLYKEYRNLQRG